MEMDTNVYPRPGPPRCRDRASQCLYSGACPMVAEVVHVTAGFGIGTQVRTHMFALAGGKPVGSEEGVGAVGAPYPVRSASQVERQLSRIE